MQTRSEGPYRLPRRTPRTSPSSGADLMQSRRPRERKSSPRLLGAGGLAAGDDLARVEQAGRIPQRLPPALPVEQLLALLHVHVIALGQTDAVLAGEGPAELDRVREDTLGR